MRRIHEETHAALDAAPRRGQLPAAREPLRRLRRRARRASPTSPGAGPGPRRRAHRRRLTSLHRAMDIDVLTVVAGVAGSCGVALLGWALGGVKPEPERPRSSAVPAQPDRRDRSRRGGRRRRRRGCPDRRCVLGPSSCSTSCSVRARTCRSPPIAMFSRPAREHGRCVRGSRRCADQRSARSGSAPHIVRKRFETELQRARAHGVHDPGRARRRSAVIAGLWSSTDRRREPWPRCPSPSCGRVRGRCRALSRMRIPILGDDAGEPRSSGLVADRARHHARRARLRRDHGFAASSSSVPPASSSVRSASLGSST